MPATKRVNSQKKDKLISLDLLQKAEDGIANWWQLAYRDRGNSERAMRFEQEARASLPVEQDLQYGSFFGPGLADPADGRFEHLHFIETLSTKSILEAMRYQRLRLQQDQQLPEWDGPKS